MTPHESKSGAEELDGGSLDADSLRTSGSLLLSEDPRYRITPMQQVVSALIGGLITTFVVTPLEVVKTRVQTQHSVRQPATVSKLCYVFHNGLMTHICKPRAEDCVAKPVADATQTSVRPLRGAMDALLKIYCSNGLLGFWSGLSPTLFSALPSNIIYFVTYEYLKQPLSNLYYTMRPGKHASGAESADGLQPAAGRSLPPLVPMVSGIMSRTVVVTAVTPIEMVRIKMQSENITYAELWRVLRSLIQTQGVLGLWRGLPPTIMRDAPFSGTYWLTYESLKRAFEVTEPTFQFSFVAGAASGVLATWVTMPFDLITTHTQIELGQDVLYAEAAAASGGATAVPKRPSVFSRLGNIYRKQGMRGLYIGIMPRMLRVVPACAIMISTFEYSKSFFFHYNVNLSTSAYRNHNN